MNCVFAILALALVLEAQQPEGRFERTLAVPGPVDLDVLTDAGGIVVRGGAAGSVQVRGILKSSGGHWPFSGDVESRIRALEKNPPVEQSGNTIRIGHVNDRDLLRGVMMRLEITTPAATRLRARADSGGIRVSGIQGPADCKTDSGGIHIQDVRGAVHARADSGGIEATGIGGTIDAATDSGGLRLGQTVAAPIRARTDSGGATVRLASTGGYEIRAESGSGGVNVPGIALRGTPSRHRAEGTLRGGGPLVDVRAGSGHVQIE